MHPGIIVLEGKARQAYEQEPNLRFVTEWEDWPMAVMDRTDSEK